MIHYGLMTHYRESVLDLDLVNNQSNTAWSVVSKRFPSSCFSFFTPLINSDQNFVKCFATELLIFCLADVLNAAIEG